jgi:hypothetical protein
MSATTITTITADVAKKQFTQTGSRIAVREEVTIRIKGCSSAAVADLKLSIMKDDDELAYCDTFTDSGSGYYSGTLSLATVELITDLTNIATGRFGMYDIILWDTTNDNALIIDSIKIYAHKFNESLTPPTQAEMLSLGGYIYKGTSGEVLAKFIIVRVDSADGKVYACDCADATEADSAIGVTYTAATAANQDIYVLTYGLLTDTTLSVFVGGDSIFFDTNGALTTTAPTSGYAQQVAVGADNNTININIHSSLTFT